MFKINSFFFSLAACILLLGSCKKDDDQYMIQTGRFPAAGLTASKTSATLTRAAENDTAISFTWPAASFGEKPVITYTLQVDKVSDTSGSAAWSGAKSVALGTNIIKYGFIVKDLNALLVSLGLPAGSASDVAVRIKADVPQYNGSASSIASAYSNIVAVKITTYATILYVPGEYQGWSPPTAPVLNQVEGRTNLYEGYVNITGTGIQYFKYTNAPDWNHINYGDGGNGNFSTDGNAGGLSVPGSGYYELTANFNTNKWTATKTTWGIIGDATPGGWSGDTQMSYNATTQVWTVTCNMTAGGSFKFRANNAWNIDFGIDGNGKLAYADNPFFTYNPNLTNLTVPTTGNYTITLDLHVSGNYTYTLHKN